MGSVEDTLQNFQLDQRSFVLSKINSENTSGDGKIDIEVGKQSHCFEGLYGEISN